jgi:hypothetical protein
VKNLVGLLIVACWSLLGTCADAQVLTFNDLAPYTNDILGNVVCTTGDGGGTGFRFASDHFHVIGTSPTFLQNYTSNGTTHIGYESLRGFPVVMERFGGGTFALLSLDAAEFFFTPFVDRPDAETIIITGTQEGGGTVSHTITLDGLRDGPGGIDDYEHFVLPGTFVNLTSVMFTGLHSTNGDGGIGLDNIEFATATPEAVGACVSTPLPPETPVTSFTSPAAGNVAGTVLVSAVATDDVAVTSVQFKLDGANLGPALSTGPYTYSWGTTGVADGAHTLTVEARDAANNVGTASVVVTVQNSPPPTDNDPHYLELDGIDDYAQVGDANGLSFGTGTADFPLTFELWMRPDAMVRHQLLGKWGAGNHQEYKLQISSGVIRVDLRDPSAGVTVSAYTGNQTALAGAWHHVAVTYDGRGGATAANGIVIYIDGVAVAVGRINNGAYVAMENTTAPLQIGRESAQWKQFDGGLDDMRIWNVARTASEIQGSITTELTGIEAGLVAYWPFNEGTGTGAGDASPSGFAALLNVPLWMDGGPLAPVEPDVTPPEITNVVTSSLTESGITIRFSTNEVATGWVSYSIGGSCPCTDVYGSAVGIAHVVTLTGLMPGTVYGFVVKATDTSTNMQVTSPMTFQTPVPPPDNAAPGVTFVRPNAGVVFGEVIVEATAVDAVGVVGVQFKLDGVALGAPDATNPYSLTWDTTTATEGPHRLTAEAHDAAGNIGVASVEVTVSHTSIPVTSYYLELDGTDDALQVADANALSFGTGATDTPLTLEVWMRPDMMDRHQLLGKWSAGLNQEYRLQISSGVIRLDLRDSSAAVNVSAYTGNQTALIGGWHHVAATYDGRGGATAANGIVIYVDGVAVAVSRINNVAYVAMENTTAPLQIGRESVQWKQFDGGLDDMRIWNVARTASEIQGSITTELTGIEAGLVAYWPFNEGTGTTAADASQSGLTAALLGGTGWAFGGPLAPMVPDTTAPEISNIAASNLTASGVTINFTTNEGATGWVSYAVGSTCPCTDVFSAATGTSHAVTLSGLAPNTSYRFVINASDAASNLQTTALMTFQTLALPPDTTAPVATFVRPAAGIVSGTVVVEVTATDAVGVDSVQFFLDGLAFGAPDTTAPYVLAWDSLTSTDGPHTLSAEVRDAADNVGTATIAVTVTHTPPPTQSFYVEFDGTDDALQVADNNLLSFGNGIVDTPFSIEMWLRPDAMVRHQLLGKWSGGVLLEYRLHIAAGVIRLDLSAAGAAATVSAYTGNQTALVGSWHHLAVTYDGRGGATAAAGITIYIDGIAVPVTRQNNAAYVAMENTSLNLQIGRESLQWRQFDGGLDEIRMWSVARGASEIQAAMSTALSGAEAGLVAYWRLNSGSGTTATDEAGGHTATLMKGAEWTSGGAPLP